MTIPPPAVQRSLSHILLSTHFAISFFCKEVSSSHTIYFRSRIHPSLTSRKLGEHLRFNLQTSLIASPNSASSFFPLHISLLRHRLSKERKYITPRNSTSRNSTSPNTTTQLNRFLLNSLTQSNAIALQQHHFRESSDALIVDTTDIAVWHQHGWDTCITTSFQASLEVSMHTLAHGSWI